MADSVVSSTVIFALDNLSRLLVNEVKLLSGVKDEIHSLRDELRWMHIFLKNSEGKRNDDIVKEVVNQIRDVAYQAEDVIDTYVVKKHKDGKVWRKLFHVPMVHDICNQIKKINVKIKEIHENKDKYGIERGDFKSGDLHNTAEEYAESLRRRRRDVEEEEIVGLVDDSDKVIEKLLMEDDPRRTVISIIGMGGLGKTTLARKIYNMSEGMRWFSHHAWGYVSNDYRAVELLLSLLECLNSCTPEDKDSSVEQLKKKVRDCLKGKKYLVVLDDIWETGVWDEVKGVFPDDKNGSRILITTRIKDVASYSKSILTYELPFLSKEDSWHLFHKKVFGEEECPSDLEPLGREMVESCKGLPLAIIVLAGLIAKKEKTNKEWMRIRNGVNWQLDEEKMVMDILKLSYDNLPQGLKPCFLYFGTFPEDYVIPTSQLIKLWIAEGFIQPKEIGTSSALEPEYIADFYLDELVDRSLLQVVQKRRYEGVRFCRIHDLLLDLCISESKANKFLEVCTELTIDKCNSRRLSLQCKECLPTRCSQPHLHPRSLFVFADRLDWDGESEGWEWIRKTLKLVRVLDLQQVKFDSPPSRLKTLIHLRYLFIRAKDPTTGNNILASTCNLWNLETLYLIVNGKSTIPSGVWKLKRLKHVYVLNENFVYDGHWLEQPAQMARGENSEASVSLQRLGRVCASPALESMLNKGFFPNLIKLTLYVDEKSSTAQQLSSLHRLSKLHKLKIFNIPAGADVFLSNLAKITLREFESLHSGIMNALGRLPKLQILKLGNGVISGSINCVAGEFTKLELLYMNRITVEGQWRQEKGAMPHLRRLILLHCKYWDEQQQTFQPYASASNELSKVQLNSGCNVVIEEDWLNSSF